MEISVVYNVLGFSDPLMLTTQYFPLSQFLGKNCSSDQKEQWCRVIIAASVLMIFYFQPNYP